MLEEEGALSRATRDIDMILFVEALTGDFIKAFWSFIDAGGYQTKLRSSGKPRLYRFQKPKDRNYPYLIELFSRDESMIGESPQDGIIPLAAPDELSDLSAILLNENYYSLAQKGARVLNGITILGTHEIILFKAKAYLELSSQKASGSLVHISDIKKHRNDIFRLACILSEKPYLIDDDLIKSDLVAFIDIAKPTSEELWALKVGITNPDQLIETLGKVFLPGIASL